MKINSQEEVRIKREEINHFIEHYNSSLIFLYTGVIVTLSFGITAKQPLIIFFSVIVNFFLWQRHVFWKEALAQHSAYCQVFLENDESGCFWETINHQMSELESKSNLNNAKEVEVIILALLSEMFFIVNILFPEHDLHRISMSDFTQNIHRTSPYTWVFIGLSLIFIVYFIVKFIKTKDVHSLRNIWIKKYSDYLAQRKDN